MKKFLMTILLSFLLEINGWKFPRESLTATLRAPPKAFFGAEKSRSRKNGEQDEKKITNFLSHSARELLPRFPKSGRKREARKVIVSNQRETSWFLRAISDKLIFAAAAMQRSRRMSAFPSFSHCFQFYSDDFRSRSLRAFSRCHLPAFWALSGSKICGFSVPCLVELVLSYFPSTNARGRFSFWPFGHDIVPRGQIPLSGANLCFWNMIIKSTFLGPCARILMYSNAVM